MPLINVTLRAGLGPEIKSTIREEICRETGALIGISPSLIAVLFTELPPEDMNTAINCFVHVYISEGRPPEFKDALVALLTDALTRDTGWNSEGVSVMIYDFRHGSIAVSGRIVNRGGTAAEGVKKGG